MKERPILFSGAMVRAILEDRKTQTRRVVKGPIGYLGGQGGESDLSSWGWFFDGPQHHGYMVLARGMNQRHDHGCISIPCPYGQTGDRLWVRETWAYNGQSSKNYGPTESRREGYVTYAADGVRKTLVFPEGPMLDAPKQHIPVRGEGEDEVDHAVRVDAYYKDYFRRSRPSIFMPRWASRLTLEVTEVRVQRLQEISEEDARAEGALVAPTFDARHLSLGHGARGAFASLWDSINSEREGCSWEANPWAWCVSFRRVS